MKADSFSAKRKRALVKLNKGSTAILVVDMLNDFLKPGGKMVLEGGGILIPPMRRLLNRARKVGIPAVYVNDCHRPGLKEDREFKKRSEHCIEGTWGAQVIEELKPKKKDFVVLKHRFSGFYDTDLDLTLKDLCIDTVIVMGVVTNICVRSTIHDAFFRGYTVLVPRDCVMATGEREQESSLYDIETHFGDVTSSDKLIGMM
ncbi:MAG: cysteine hydrolase [Deltaproteobacteria bacterium]|nr:cysteine hydrolase [Deltaproteobacteria bacterium]